MLEKGSPLILRKRPRTLLWPFLIAEGARNQLWIRLHARFKSAHDQQSPTPRQASSVNGRNQCSEWTVRVSKANQLDRVKLIKNHLQKFYRKGFQTAQRTGFVSTSSHGSSASCNNAMRWLFKNCSFGRSKIQLLGAESRLFRHRLKTEAGHISSIG